MATLLIPRTLGIGNDWPRRWFSARHIAPDSTSVLGDNVLLRWGDLDAEALAEYASEMIHARGLSGVRAVIPDPEQDDVVIDGTIWCHPLATDLLNAYDMAMLTVCREVSASVRLADWWSRTGFDQLLIHQARDARQWTWTDNATNQVTVWAAVDLSVRERGPYADARVAAEAARRNLRLILEQTAVYFALPAPLLPG